MIFLPAAAPRALLAQPELIRRPALAARVALSMARRVGASTALGEKRRWRRAKSERDMAGLLPFVVVFARGRRGVGKRKEAEVSRERASRGGSRLALGGIVIGPLSLVIRRGFQFVDDTRGLRTLEGGDGSLVL